jgi:hypothetical protein
MGHEPNEVKVDRVREWARRVGLADQVNLPPGDKRFNSKERTRQAAEEPVIPDAIEDEVHNSQVQFFVTPREGDQTFEPESRVEEAATTPFNDDDWAQIRSLPREIYRNLQPGDAGFGVVLPGPAGATGGQPWALTTSVPLARALVVLSEETVSPTFEAEGPLLGGQAYDLPLRTREDLEQLVGATKARRALAAAGVQPNPTPLGTQQQDAQETKAKNPKIAALEDHPDNQTSSSSTSSSEATVLGLPQDMLNQVLLIVLAILFASLIVQRA